MDPIPNEHLAAYAVCFLCGLPVIVVMLWKAMDTARKRRAREAMKEGNRIYKDWLDSSAHQDLHSK